MTKISTATAVPLKESYMEYQEFLDWCEEQGLEFPCTSTQFHARAEQYAGHDEDLIDFLCEEGIGPDWKNLV